MPARHANRERIKPNKQTQVIAGGPARITSNLSFLFAIFVLMLVSTLANIIAYIERPPHVVTIDTTADDFAFWSKIIENNSTYRDGYLVLYELEGENGDLREQERLIGKAVNIDPFVSSDNLEMQVLSATDEK
jgi:hypothetical protein